MKKRKLRYHWIYDGKVLGKKDQILEIEKYHFTVKELMENMDYQVKRLIKEAPELAPYEDEIREVIEQFLIDVGSSIDLEGGME